MNFIQKAWLTVLTPAAHVINEKIATRPGMAGRIGRFWAIGPREFGVHPLNNFMRYVIRHHLQTIGWLLHRQSLSKTFTQRGYNVIRPVIQANLTCYLLVAGLLSYPILSGFQSMEKST